MDIDGAALLKGLEGIVKLGSSLANNLPMLIKGRGTSQALVVAAAFLVANRADHRIRVLSSKCFLWRLNRSSSTSWDLLGS